MADALDELLTVYLNDLFSTGSIAKISVVYFWIFFCESFE